jgi:hypothetical protein
VDAFGFGLLWSYFGNDVQIGGAWAISHWQDLVAAKVYGFGADGGVREIALGEAANFVGGGLDPVGSIGAGAELFVLGRSVGGRIDDSVVAVGQRFALRS